MICVFLAAGYATRLYPLTEHFPKPLLPVGGKPILDWLLEDVAAAGGISRYLVVSNHVFAEHFRGWAAGKALPIEVLDDGTSTNETRLGAVRDLLFAAECAGCDEDYLVLAGDNVLDFSLRRFIEYGRAKGASCIMRYAEPNPDRLRKCGVIVVDERDRVLEMAEKPQNPKSHFCVPPFYYYRSADVARVREALDHGCNADAPGSFAAWLAARAPLYAMPMPGARYDVGNLASYERIRDQYRGAIHV